MPMIIVFSLARYTEHLKTVRQLSDDTAALLIELNGYAAFDGQPLDMLLAEGHLIIDAWCEPQLIWSERNDH